MGGGTIPENPGMLGVLQVLEEKLDGLSGLWGCGGTSVKIATLR